MTGMNRRSFMKIGSLSLGGLTLPSLLKLRQVGAASRANDTSVILLWMAGGPSHIDTYDLKPDAPSEVRGPFQPIETNLPGLQVCELMPGHAAIADKLAVIRSFRHKYGEVGAGRIARRSRSFRLHHAQEPQDVFGNVQGRRTCGRLSAEERRQLVNASDDAFDGVV